MAFSYQIQWPRINCQAINVDKRSKSLKKKEIHAFLKSFMAFPYQI